ncbi:DUF3084 domain-containing protein [cf. Phormidesmis sp. LEGE 11477]|uniref:DUF3084 domain-containing protein n=1 Tax=cf. Phormidesmis sp. LEGE 11477 TaxID=1828680 RepID=UPI001880A46D|nr:DUF3084 domain-containing protein [cf. Phormidesmis sp. LEGE 11477]MBE9061272.1 DUF3084 domain-containing protein [cf. Phormidesmis sp. LEGE 11477]
MTGFILLFAVACLGGVIATVGDRIGMKVGKSRLSLFNLRPRQTATLVSVVTGMVASFSTLMLLIALDGQLRKGLFQLDDIQQDLSEAQSDLESAVAEREVVEGTLEESRELQTEAQDRLRQTNRSLRTAIAREEETLSSLIETQDQLESVSTQIGSLRDEIGGLRAERQQLIEERATVRSQIERRDQALRERDQELQLRDQQIAQRDQDIEERTRRLNDLQAQQTLLTEEIARLDDEFQVLRLGNVAIRRNETLAVTIARSDSEAAAQRAVEAALIQANAIALRNIWPGLEEVNNFVIQFDPDVVQQIIESTTDTRSYLIRVYSAANYVVGEPCVGEILNAGGEPCLQVNLEAPVNEIRYIPGETIASVQVRSEDLTNEDLAERYRALQVRAEIQARRDGIIYFNPIVARGLSDPVLDFLRQVQVYNQPIEIQAIASQSTYTIGPVYLELAAVQRDRVLFTTQSLQTEAPNNPASPEPETFRPTPSSLRKNNILK